MTTIPNNPTVKLTPAEILNAAICGVMRQAQNIKNGNESRIGPEDVTEWQTHIEGALGECAFAKWLGVYWPGKGELRAGDVGDLQVKTTRYATGKLAIQPRDSDSAVYVLLTGANGAYTVRGWLYGREIKREEWFGQLKPGSTIPPSFSAPQSALHPMHSLPLRNVGNDIALRHMEPAALT